MAFHPSVNEGAIGFWGGYYKGLAYLLWGCIVFINLAVVGRNFLMLSFEDALKAIGAWYSYHLNISFYIAVSILFVLGAISYIVGLSIDTTSKNTRLKK